MTRKLSLVLAAAIAAEVFAFGAAPAVAAPLRLDQGTYTQSALVTEVRDRRHWGGRRGNNAAAAIIGGLAAGAIIGGLAARPRYYDYYGGYDYYDRPPPRVYYQRRVYRQPVVGIGPHEEWCLNRWRSYDVRSDTYQPNKGPRRYCTSPYN